MNKEKKLSNNKYIIISIILFLIIMLFIFLLKKPSIEKDIIGSWTSIDERGCIATNMSEVITFNKDNTIIGIEGYKTYSIENTSNDDYDYAILSGGYEDSARYRIKIMEDKTLKIVYEDNDTYDFDSAIACHMKKTEG